MPATQPARLQTQFFKLTFWRQKFELVDLACNVLSLPSCCPFDLGQGAACFKQGKAWCPLKRVQAKHPISSMRHPSTDTSHTACEALAPDAPFPCLSSPSAAVQDVLPCALPSLGLPPSLLANHPPLCQQQLLPLLLLALPLLKQRLPTPLAAARALPSMPGTLNPCQLFRLGTAKPVQPSGQPSSAAYLPSAAE